MSNGLTPEDMVTDIENHASDKMNDWERKFVRDIGDKLDKGRTLSEKQIAKLQAIYEDHVG